LIPELICFKKGQIWNLGVRFWGNLSNFTNVQIIQNDRIVLAEDDEYYKINKLAPIIIKWNDNGKTKGGFKFQVQPMN